MNVLPPNGNPGIVPPWLQVIQPRPIPFIPGPKPDPDEPRIMVSPADPKNPYLETVNAWRTLNVSMPK